MMCGVKGLSGTDLGLVAENRQRRHILNKPLWPNILHVNGVMPRHFPSHELGLSTPFWKDDERQGMISKQNVEIVTVGKADFPRYIIMAASGAASEHRRFWAGQKWITQRHLALLYADRSVAVQDLAEISSGGL